jgi:hypothetical protein
MTPFSIRENPEGHWTAWFDARPLGSISSWRDVAVLRREFQVLDHFSTSYERDRFVNQFGLPSPIDLAIGELSTV